MNRTLISFAMAAALAAPAAFAEVLDDSGSSGESSTSFDQVDSENRLDTVDSDLEGATLDNSVENTGSKAWGGSASANNGSHAETDNRVFLRDSALTSNELGGSISGNAVHMNDSKSISVNKVEDGAFKDSRGVSQVSQNGGQNSLIQQSLSLQANVKVDHHASSSP